jgi:hypothetical protein
MAILLVRSFDEPRTKTTGPLGLERGDIFEVRADGRTGLGTLGGGWAKDLNPRPRRGSFATYCISIPGLCPSRIDLMSSQSVYSVPEWLRGNERPNECTLNKPDIEWVRGSWLDLDALEYRHQLYLEQTGRCCLTLPELQSVFHTMDPTFDCDLMGM